MKIQVLQKVLVVLIICIIFFSGVFTTANAQVGFLFGLLMGSSMSEGEQVFPSNQIYLNKEKLDHIVVEDIRFIQVNLYSSNEGRTLNEMFQEERVIQVQIKKGYWYEWICIWREGTNFIFAYILK